VLEGCAWLPAGKSTVREIIGSNNFWSAVGSDAVVIEADAIKNQDVVYQARCYTFELADRLHWRCNKERLRQQSSSS
jgi:hypothetical protein